MTKFLLTYVFHFSTLETSVLTFLHTLLHHDPSNVYLKTENTAIQCKTWGSHRSSVGQVVPERQQSLWVKHYMTAWPWKYRTHDPSKRLELPIQWHSIISKKTLLFNALQFQWEGTSRMNLKPLSAVHTEHSAVTVQQGCQTNSTNRMHTVVQHTLYSNVRSLPGASHNSSRTVGLGRGGENW
jgi:hypothetical protein